MKRPRVLAWVALLFAPSLWAITTSGRVTLGAYTGIEQLAESSGGEFRNDVFTASGRFFFRAAEITANRFEFVSDVRDKNDFFGLLDKERLRLTNANTLQLRQLLFRYPGPTFFTQLGRFAVPEAGAVYTDGVQQGVHLLSSLRGSVFGGLNPKRPEQTYVQYNPDSQVYGVTVSYVPLFIPGKGSIAVDMAGVGTLVNNQTDRLYWYTNSVYQWGPRSRVSLLTYLDFVPNTYLQNGTLNYSQEVRKDLGFGVTLFSIDVLEYQRRQNVREQLTSSPYREANTRVRYEFAPDATLNLTYAFGQRDSDSLQKKEATLELDMNAVFSRRWDFAVSGGYRDNFASYDTFANARINYISNVWEVALEEQLGIENYKGGGPTYHPITTELSISRIIDNSLYGTLSIQDIRDERVQILSTFFKIAYRFGSREIPPLRDGEPPRGNL
ncbi:MAG: hypothetical protein HYR96_08550 [Deltaproteobacteria bacterium]|nr:hypothetical protein [Deltaproteobacteria bacterium]MBI3294661.1 hypothetical protein [Deltaproteobacteria bacterium]